MMLKILHCKEYCSKDATCLGVTSKNDGSGLCSLKRTEFIKWIYNPSIPSISLCVQRFSAEKIMEVVAKMVEGSVVSQEEFVKIKTGNNWQKRVDVAVGVTRALAYLHIECKLCIPHGNLKLENVLLDEIMAASSELTKPRLLLRGASGYTDNKLSMMFSNRVQPLLAIPPVGSDAVSVEILAKLTTLIQLVRRLHDQRWWQLQGPSISVLTLTNRGNSLSENHALSDLNSYL
ncbi:hypothetical protein L2E82_20709 [Cichorium intybus]|uniref:Uncharacterized protein n=1 Tax=Cichorium intybus TaxID=13427 RepID=A0ACB9DTM8_CICIN|nr:hypothetical protein L2E82_20709 [Cichorium intybus]